jgi:hypothetical protein
VPRQVKLRNHSVIGVVKRDELVALVGKRGASLLEIAANLDLAVVHIARGYDLVPG